jgi:hypothetical protein
MNGVNQTMRGGYNDDLILSAMWCGDVLRHKSCWRVLSERRQINVSYRDGLWSESTHGSPRAATVGKR